MVEGVAKVYNPTGLHDYSISQLTNFTNKFKCRIYLIQDNIVSNAKSTLNVLMLDLKQGSDVTVRVDGMNEENVLKEVIHYIESFKS